MESTERNALSDASDQEKKWPEAAEFLVPTDSDWQFLRAKYLEKRVQDQINWYEKKSAANKRWFHRLRVATIACGALIPLLVGYANNSWEWLKYLAGLLGVVVAISEGLISLHRYHEKWHIYRLTAERLIRERWLYESGASEEYAQRDEVAFRRFVQRAEQIMASENEEWRILIEKSKEEKQA
ncbi:MAG: DUF4231 domain-containing protein [Saprospiraceae bacterium]|nr:DUF4231 domain-containing protein [Saprospiraceae bacterium]MDW8484960.1 DUF4231 domain-containing protein [Saprospiraceae bacterium]